MSNTGSQKNLNIGLIRNLKLWICPLPEQTAIASLLETWDTTIEKTEALIAAKEKQFKWLLKRLISDQQNNPEWKKIGLKSVGSTFTGLAGKSKADFGRGKPFIPYLNIYSNINIDPSNLDLCFVAEDEKQNKIRRGDAFFTTSSETPDEVGTSSVLLHDIDECYLNSFCFGWRRNGLGREILSENYLKYFFRSPVFRKQIRKLSQGATRYNLSKGHLVETWIAYPEIRMQQRIARVLDKIQLETQLMKQLTEQYRTQKHGLMQKLLPGVWKVSL